MTTKINLNEAKTCTFDIDLDGLDAIEASRLGTLTVCRLIHKLTTAIAVNFEEDKLTDSGIKAMHMTMVKGIFEFYKNKKEIDPILEILFSKII